MDKKTVQKRGEIMRQRENQLDQSFVYKKLKKELVHRYGKEKACAIWEEAGERLRKLETAEPETDKTSRMFTFPAAAIYQAIERYAPGDALGVTRAYGKQFGQRVRKIFRRITALPGVPALMWKHMDKLAGKMSDGYGTKNMVVTTEECRLDVISCPICDKAKELGVPEAAQMICCMDKEYMTGIRGMDYRRTKSLAEGDDCCDYRMKRTGKKSGGF